MDSHSMIILLVIVVLLLILSIFFSAGDEALVHLNRIKLKNMANEGDKRAGRIIKLLEQQDRLFYTIKIGNAIANIGITLIAALIFIEQLGYLKGAVLTAVIATLVILIFCELLPNSLVKKSPEKFMLFAAGGMVFFKVVLAPVYFIMAGCKGILSRVFNLSEAEITTEEELITIIEEAGTEGGIDEEQSELIQNAIEFNDLEAWDVLTPRVDLVAVDVETPKEEVARIFKKTGFSRLPVYEDEIDNILGVLNQKDFHNQISGTSKTVSEYVKPVVFVAGSIKISVLLKKMQTAKTHIAVVIDEYGGTEGIVTMEDIIEELVGEIYDEHDSTVSQDILQLKDESYRVLGSTNVEKMFHHFDIEVEMDVTTVNGWVVTVLDNLPKVGDSFVYRAEDKIFKVRVTKADQKRAIEINMTVEEAEEEPETVK